MVIYLLKEPITIFYVGCKLFIYSRLRRYVIMENFQNKYLEIKNIDKDIVGWVEDIAEENNCRIERKEWKSKYNSYVVYDYEPFCSEGFEINILLSSFDISYLNFIKYLYNEKLSTIDYLNSCIKNPAIKF